MYIYIYIYICLYIFMVSYGNYVFNVFMANVVRETIKFTFTLFLKIHLKAFPDLPVNLTMSEKWKDILTDIFLFSSLFAGYVTGCQSVFSAPINHIFLHRQLSIQQRRCFFLRRQRSTAYSIVWPGTVSPAHPVPEVTVISIISFFSPVNIKVDCTTDQVHSSTDSQGAASIAGDFNVNGITACTPLPAR